MMMMMICGDDDIPNVKAAVERLSGGGGSGFGPSWRGFRLWRRRWRGGRVDPLFLCFFRLFFFFFPFYSVSFFPSCC